MMILEKSTGTFTNYVMQLRELILELRAQGDEVDLLYNQRDRDDSFINNRRHNYGSRGDLDRQYTYGHLDDYNHRDMYDRRDVYACRDDFNRRDNRGDFDSRDNWGPVPQNNDPNRRRERKFG